MPPSTISSRSGAPADMQPSPQHTTSSSSTRDQLLQKYLKSDAAADSRAGGASSSKPQMECFESEDVNEQTQTSQANAGLRTDRSLLASIASKKSSTAGGSVNSDDVDTSAIRPTLAFQTFAGALYRGSGDATNAAATTGVYETGSDLVAAHQKTSFESPFARLTRLQEELRDFQTDLVEASKSATKLTAASNGSSGTAAQHDDSWGILGTNVLLLQQQLDRILTSEQYKNVFEKSDANAASSSSAVASASLSSGVPGFDNLFTHYVEQLHRDPKFVPLEISAGAIAAAPSSASTAAANELHTALPKLDERLAAMEKFIGLTASTNKSTSTAGASASAGSLIAPSSSSSSSLSLLPSPDLLTSLTHLHSQLQSLNPTRLEYVVRTLKQIALEQESIANSRKEKEEAGGASTSASGEEKKAEDGAAASTSTAPVNTPPYATQIASIYSLTQRWDGLALSLPTLITRLSSLHSLHASCASFVTRMQQLDATTQRIDSHLIAQADGMKRIQASALENMKQMKENFTAMEKRMEEINKKMAQLKK